MKFTQSMKGAASTVKSNFMKFMVLVVAAVFAMTLMTACSSDDESTETNSAETTTETTNTASSETDSQSAAVEQAKDYVDSGEYDNRDDLVNQLENDGYSADDAEYAADNCGYDWGMMM